MIFSFNLLKTLVDLEGIEAKDLAERLTFSGFEVEELKPATQASNLVSGHVLTCVPHPDSDHMHCLTVDCGPAEGVRKIVCGAPNVHADQNVIVALPGCELPASKGVIKHSVIRGEESDGMCCSLIELGMDENFLPESETIGIHDLGPDYAPGDKDVLAHIGLADWLLDVNVLPNRPDCLSYLGLAREIAALTGRVFKGAPRASLDNLPQKLTTDIKTDSCFRLAVLGAKLGDRVDQTIASKIALWLELSGHRPISPIVDLGNFVMLLTGQPFHVYDLDKAATSSFTAADDREEDFHALDGKTYRLNKGDVVIDADDGRILGLAGIMGGDASKDEASTRNIAIESASFYHAPVRRASARLGLASASSNLFGKGVNARLCRYALEVFASQLKSLFPDAELTSFCDKENNVKVNQPFEFSVERLNHRLGTDYSNEEVSSVLIALGIERLPDGKLLGPVWRTDVNEQADIDEEVFRFYPADRVPLSYEGLPLTQGGLTPAQRAVEDLRELLRGRGISEIMTFTLVDEKEANEIRVFDDKPCFRVKNPLTRDHEFVRADLLPSMVLALDYNRQRQHSDLAFYEISDVDCSKGRLKMLSIGFSGLCYDQELSGSRPYDFYDLKAVAENLLALLGINASRVRFARSTNPAFHPGKSCDLMMGKTKVATFGELHPGLFKQGYLVGEFNLTELLAIKTGRTKFTPFAVYPSVRRDLSFAITGEVDFSKVVTAAKKASKGLLKECRLFDVYEDRKTGAKSLGLALYFAAADHTLKDSETEAETLSIASELTRQFPLALKK